MKRINSVGTAALGAVVVAAALVGCSSVTSTQAGGSGFGGLSAAQGVSPSEASTFSGTVPGEPAEVFQVMAQVYERLGIPVDFQDEGRLTLGANDALLRRVAGTRLEPYLSCASWPGGPSTDEYDVYVSIETTLSAAEGGGTEVGTRLTARATHPNPRVDPEICASTGRLERRIVEEVTNQLEGP